MLPPFCFRLAGTPPPPAVSRTSMNFMAGLRPLPPEQRVRVIARELVFALVILVFFLTVDRGCSACCICRRKPSS